MPWAQTCHEPRTEKVYSEKVLDYQRDGIEALIPLAEQMMEVDSSVLAALNELKSK